jgi:hypothetical protein
MCGGVWYCVCGFVGFEFKEALMQHLIDCFLQIVGSSDKQAL